jgi:CheY-like chemotaxis protein
VEGFAKMPTLTQEILLVEDEKNVRDALTRLLNNRGYQVIAARSGRQAILKAQREKVSVVLMDIALGGELDGFEAAEEIQKLHPLTSFIFVSAYAKDPKNHERARKKKIRVGGWIEKPFKLDLVVELIERERKRLKILESTWDVEEKGLDPHEYLRFQEQTENLPPDLMEDLYSELEIVPLDEGEEVPDMTTIAREIDGVYDQIKDMIADRGDDRNLADAVRPLREKLRALQKEEARAIELYVRSQLLFDPREARRLLDRAERLLKSK